MKTQPLACPACGARLDVTPGTETLDCPNCGRPLGVEYSTSDERRRLVAHEVTSDPEAVLDDGVASVPPVKSRRYGIAIVLGIAVIFVGGLLALLMAKPPQKSLCDEAAPALTVSLFDQYRGTWEKTDLNLADLKGKGVVLNFWASWCQPCEQEAADLEAAWRQYKDKGIVFVGIDYLDQEPSAKRYLDKFKISYANGPDLEGKMSRRYTIRGVPETFFIDPDGKIVGCRKMGPLDPTELQQRIAEIMPK